MWREWTYSEDPDLTRPREQLVVRWPDGAPLPPQTPRHSGRDCFLGERGSGVEWPPRDGRRDLGGLGSPGPGGSQRGVR